MKAKGKLTPPPKKNFYYTLPYTVLDEIDSINSFLTAGLKAITTVKYHPVQVSDAADSYICGPAGTLSGTHFELIVMPSKFHIPFFLELYLLCIYCHV